MLFVAPRSSDNKKPLLNPKVRKNAFLFVWLEPRISNILFSIAELYTQPKEFCYFLSLIIVFLVFQLAVLLLALLLA